jgi:hypothetical protein
MRHWNGWRSSCSGMGREEGVQSEEVLSAQYRVQQWLHGSGRDLTATPAARQGRQERALWAVQHGELREREQGVRYPLLPRLTQMGRFSDGRTAVRPYTRRGFA